MKRVVLFFFSVIVSMAVFAQDADSLAGKYLNESDWFGLQTLYRSDSIRMSPFIRCFSKAMLTCFFNQPEEANIAIRRLLNDYQEEIGFGNVLSMMTLMARNHSHLGQYKEAGQLLRKFLTQLQGKVDEKVTAPLVAQAERYEALARYNINHLTTQGDNYPVDFRLKEVGDSAQMLMFMKGKINGKTNDFIFDTGAGYNVITPELAQMYGLEFLEGSIKTEGTRTIQGQMAIAKQLVLGGIKLENVPFLVLDVTQGNEFIKGMTAPLQLIIGQPFLRLFGKYTIDFDRQQIVFTRNVTRQDVESNLVLTGSDITQVKVGKDGHRFPMVLDTGATTSSMGPDYYKTFTAEITRTGKWDIRGGSGYGGIVYNSVFVMPSITFEIGGKSMTMPKIAVTAMSSEKNVIHAGYGRLGLDFFRQCKRVEIDNINMTFNIQ
ncbi:MAG: pepsin/retropepsin-like aspartic protease family protein [Prevotella sp.]|jgi:hypothetical protein